MQYTNLDELVYYPQTVINSLLTSQKIIDLLADKENASISDIEDEGGNLRYIFDYEHVDETVQEAAAYICIDLIADDLVNSSVISYALMIHVIVHRHFMKLDKRIFKGMPGNRRDNLLRFIDNIVNGMKIGIGRAELDGIKKITLPSYFTGRTLVYQLSDFNRRGQKANI